MLALGLDTSCYTTSAALCPAQGEPFQARRLLPVPAGERGLRQSEAVFAHVRQIGEMVKTVMAKAQEPISCVCASSAPRDGEDSYMPVFEVGKNVGKTVASALGVPFFETTHQRGHIAAARFGTGLEAEKFIALHLSGGTTDVLLSDGDRLLPLGASVDLHAGQLVDRIGVRLGLPFPCGPYLEALARNGHAEARVPASMEKDGLHCHLSGAEAQLMRMAETEKPENVAAEVYSVLCRTVLRMVSAAAEEAGTDQILLAGGVASSGLLREEILRRNARRRLGLTLFFGRPEFSGDNAVGAACIGLKKLLERG